MVNGELSMFKEFLFTIDEKLNRIVKVERSVATGAQPGYQC